MILHITYLSGSYRVKGYLGLPPGLYGWNAGTLQSAVEAHFDVCAGDLPVSVIAERARRREAVPIPAVNDFPAFVYCRGGVGGFGKVRPHWVDTFASRGFVVFAPSYRGTEGGEGRDEFGGTDREDVTAAIPHAAGTAVRAPGPRLRHGIFTRRHQCGDRCNLDAQRLSPRAVERCSRSRPHVRGTSRSAPNA
jgi:hypothetical protein